MFDFVIRFSPLVFAFLVCFSLFVFHFSFFVFWHSKLSRVSYFDIGTEAKYRILHSKSYFDIWTWLNIIFWHSNSYYDIGTEAEYRILTFKILFWLWIWGQISYFDIQNHILTFQIESTIVFWHLKSYFDIWTGAKYRILAFKKYATWLFSEKIEFWHLDPQQAGGGGGVFWQNISYLVAAFAIPLNLICSMTMFWRSWILSFWPHPLSPPRGLDRCLWSKITFDMFHNYRTSVCMRQLSQKCWQLTELLQNLNIWHLTPPKGSRGGVNFNHCHVLPAGTG